MKKPRCGRDVGTRPWWMGEYQYDPCPCVRKAGHKGKCRCSCQPKESA